LLIIHIPSPAKVKGAGTSQFGFDDSWKPNRDYPNSTNHSKRTLNYPAENMNDVVMTTHDTNGTGPDNAPELTHQMQFTPSCTVSQNRTSNLPISMT
jgi:hypothetical protein